MRTITRDAARWLLTGVVLACAGPPARAASSSERDELVLSCLDDINNGRYGEVFRCAERLRERFPDSAAGAFVAATAHQTMINDYRVRRFEREFETEIAEAIARAERASRQDPSAENRFLWGAAESYRCAAWFRRGERMRAVRGALRSMRLLGEAVAAEPAFADPLLGLGLYDHAVSKLPLLGAGLFAGRRDRALERLARAHGEARFVSVNALYALQYVLVDRGLFVRALAANERLFERFPHNPVCLYNRGLILEGLGRPAEAAPAWRRLVEVLQEFGSPGQGFLAECHLHLARIAHRGGDLAEAERRLAAADVCAMRRDAAAEIDGPYASFAETRAEIARAARELSRPPRAASLAQEGRAR